MNWSTVWLSLMIIAAVVTVYASSQFQVSRDEEHRKEIANSIFEVLKSEFLLNRNLAEEHVNQMKNGTVPTLNFNIAAWETISTGGFLLNLDVAKTEALIRHYAIIKHCIELKKMIIKYSSGIDATTSTAPHLSNLYQKELLQNIKQLNASFAVLDNLPKN